MTQKPLRTIHSFVKREGRLTQGQQQAIDKLWPEFGVDFTPMPLIFSELFNRDAKTILEIGFGNGDSLWQMAQAHPENNYLGIEVQGWLKALIVKIFAHLIMMRLMFLNSRLPITALTGYNYFFLIHGTKRNITNAVLCRKSSLLKWQEH